VQELLGHAWVTTTQRYAHLEVDDLQAQVAELPADRPSAAQQNHIVLGWQATARPA
jgi:site-specific recombinase XerC